MLYLDPPFPVIDGVSFIRDSRSDLDWYYNPLAPDFVTHPDPATGLPVPAFDLIRFRGAAHTQAAAMPGTTSSAAAIFASKPSPTLTPASTIQRARPSSSPRTVNQSAAVQQSTSSASGLLCRHTATAAGVSASASPALKPAARPNRRRTRS